MCDLRWTEYLKALGPTLIAGIVAYIAWQQWRVSRATLREKLYERRWEIFINTQRFLRSIYEDAKVSSEEFQKFSETCRRARFLLGDDLSGYLEEVRSRAA